MLRIRFGIPADSACMSARLASSPLNRGKRPATRFVRTVTENLPPSSSLVMRRPRWTCARTVTRSRVRGASLTLSILPNRATRARSAWITRRPAWYGSALLPLKGMGCSTPSAPNVGPTSRNLAVRPCVNVLCRVRFLVRLCALCVRASSPLPCWIEGSFRKLVGGPCQTFFSWEEFVQKTLEFSQDL